MDRDLLITSLGSRGGKCLGAHFVLLMAGCSQHVCTRGCLLLGLCSDSSMIVMLALHLSIVLMLIRCKQRNCIVCTIPRRHPYREDVKNNRKAISDCAEVVVVAVLHISLLSQCMCMRGVLLMLPFGQCGRSRGLHLLGACSMLGVLSGALLVESDHPFGYDCFEMGHGEGGDPTRALRGERLRGALRGRKPVWRTQEGVRGGRQMSRRQATIPHLGGIIGEFLGCILILSPLVPLSPQNLPLSFLFVFVLSVPSSKQISLQQYPADTNCQN